MSIQLITGPMYAGKTSELLRRIRRLSYAKKRCILIKYAKDLRYSENNITTHDKYTLSNNYQTVSVLKLEDVYGLFDVIGIDECQFFTDLVEFSETMANSGKIVICAGLDSTFQRKPFGKILELIPLAESVTKLTAICMVCGEDASFSKRIGTETDIEVIGGSEKYLAVCRNCYFS